MWRDSAVSVACSCGISAKVAVVSVGVGDKVCVAVVCEGFLVARRVGGTGVKSGVVAHNLKFGIQIGVAL